MSSHEPIKVLFDELRMAANRMIDLVILEKDAIGEIDGLQNAMEKLGKALGYLKEAA